MKEYILTLILVASVPIGLIAQQSETSIFRGAEAYLSYGLHFTNTASLNKDLEKYDLPAFDATQMGMGAGGGVFLKRFFFGGQGVVQFGTNASSDLYQTKLIGGYGMVQAGYAVVQKPSLAVYPTLGLGGGGSMIQLNAGSRYAENEDELALQPGNNIHSGYMVFDIGINSDFFLGAESSSEKFLMGISAGYQIHPRIQAWRYEEQDLADLSKFAPDGFYVKLKVGLGSFGNI